MQRAAPPRGAVDRTLSADSPLSTPRVLPPPNNVPIRATARRRKCRPQAAAAHRKPWRGVRTRRTCPCGDGMCATMGGCHAERQRPEIRRHAFQPKHPRRMGRNLPASLPTLPGPEAATDLQAERRHRCPPLAPSPSVRPASSALPGPRADPARSARATHRRHAARRRRLLGWHKPARGVLRLGLAAHRYSAGSDWDRAPRAPRPRRWLVQHRSHRASRAGARAHAAPAAARNSSEVVQLCETRSKCLRGGPPARQGTSENNKMVSRAMPPKRDNANRL